MFRFLLFNVGHGFCAYLTTPGGGTILFDCGYDNELEFYPSRYFADRNISYVSSLYLSHFDQDHVANLLSCRRGMTFGSITRNGTVPAEFIRREKQKLGLITAAMESALEMHENWTSPVTIHPNYGGVKVTTFYNRYPRFTDMNNLSLVTFLEYDGCGLVIPGDLECEGWEALLEEEEFRRCLQKTNIFVASHHGRNAGYCEEVFEYCNPDVVILSDKGIVHDSQDHDYTKHANGIHWNDGSKRWVLTTRTDGHIKIEKEFGKGCFITTGVTL